MKYKTNRWIAISDIIAKMLSDVQMNWSSSVTSCTSIFGDRGYSQSSIQIIMALGLKFNVASKDETLKLSSHVNAGFMELCPPWNLGDNS